MNMNYEEFKKAAVEFLQGYFGRESVEEVVVPTVNKTRDSIVVFVDDKMSPHLYVDIMYDAYENWETFESIMEEAVERVMHSKNVVNYADLDVSLVKGNVVCSLVNPAFNEELLKEAVSVPFLDMAVIFRWIVEQTDDHIASIIIRKEMMDGIGLTVEEMYESALENTKKLVPAKILNIKDAFMRAINNPFELNPMLEKELPRIPEVVDEFMYVISNEYQTNGAATILDTDLLYDFASKTNGNLIIIPNSIHECILVVESMTDEETIKEILAIDNTNQIEDDARFMNHPYYFDKETRLITEYSKKEQNKIYA